MDIINDFSWKIAGAAGHGILSAGMLFARTCLRGGLSVFATAEYPSLIRGGHNHLDVRVKEGEIHSHSKYVNLLVALNRDAIDYHTGSMTSGGVIIYDSDEIELDKTPRNDVNFLPIPLSSIAKETGGPIMRNTVAIGATIALLNFDLKLFSSVLRDKFKSKEKEVVESNIASAKKGYDYAREKFDKKFSWNLESREEKGKVLITGNQALSMGAIKAGCKFYSAYPMTPASSIIAEMAANEKEFGIIVKQTEDEIAAINMAVGASFAGARSMTGTSGGGFCLMTEGLGLASMTETPIVIVEAMRPGPGSGMATHSSQADLEFILHASTDEAPRIIIAPGSVEECFNYGIISFNLAERYQMPVVILTDKYLAESYATAEEFDVSDICIDRGKLLTKVGEDFRRYKLTEDGISPRTVPGQKNGNHVACSYEHDEYGFEREEETIRIAMHNKRFRKLEMAKKEILPPELRGEENADVTIISWGSTKGPITDAIKSLEDHEINANHLHVAFLSPFPTEKIAEVIKKSKISICIEGNRTGQLAGLIRKNCLLDVDYSVHKYDGRPFVPEDLYDTIKNILEKKTEKAIMINDRQETGKKITSKELDAVRMRTFYLKG